MNSSQGTFCRLYRLVGALLLLLPILFLLLRSCNVVMPAAVVPTAEAPTSVPTTVPPTVMPPSAVPPTAVPPTAVPVAVPKLKVPSVSDWTADGLKLSGAGQPGATVEVWDGATRIGTAVVGADGIWTLVSKLAEGAHKLAVRTVDAAGNLINELPAVDITVPAAVAPPTLNLPAAADYAVDGLKLSGTGQPGATVEVWDGATKIGTAVVGADGLWSLVSKLGEGAHRLAIRMLDAAGTTLGQSAAVDITVPTAAALTAAAEVTAEGVVLSGTGQPGATLQVWDGATQVGTAVVGADGTWSLLSDLAEGAHKLAVRMVDAAGNALAESAAVDVTVPTGQGQAPAEDLAAWGQEYIVQPGDWLINLARRFYGDRELWTRIIDGTNAKAAVDSSFARITNPDRIYVGQKLWIPAAPGGK
jgi:nucleoid-associated protein YgaU